MNNYDMRLKRINDAIALKTPDRVPCVPMTETFPYLRQGHTMAQVLYDATLATQDNLKYHLDFEPDLAMGCREMIAGEGPMMEKLGMKTLCWAGMPGSRIHENSVHQFIEKEYLEEDEYHEILTDYSGWVLNNLLPRWFTALEPLKNLYVPGMVRGKASPIVRPFANGKISEAFAVLTEVAREGEKLDAIMADHTKELMNAGFPMFTCGGLTTAFDALSDSLRGTLGIMMDLVTQPDEVLEAVDQFHQRNLKMVRAQISMGAPGKFIFIPMHKGFDGFMSPAQYEKFYWPTLKGLVEEIVKLGGTPLVYTEGKYDSRLELLSDLPAGKCVIHIEEADMARAKKILGPKHCISGGFKSSVLTTGTPDKIRDEVKRLLDVVAVDGGYIFDLDYTLADVTDEAVEAMFDAVKTYGKY